MHIQRFCTLLLALTTPVSFRLAAQSGKKPVVPQPYQAEFLITSVQTLANGTTITHKTRRIEARDADGRQVTISISVSPIGGGPSEVDGQMSDPRDGSATFWMSRTHEAWIHELPPPEQRHGCWQGPGYARNYGYGPAQHRTDSAGSGRTVVAENLGTRIVHGIEAEGVRRTTTIPKGQMGNDAPLVTTREEWWDRPLNLVIQSETDDPIRGKSSWTLLSLKLGEPDPALFKPPADYKVIVQHMQKVPCTDLESGKP